jgi:deoxyribodipyrimidine photolyase-related protein
MWTDQPFLYYSRVSAPLNLKLLHPRRCLDMAIAAYEELAAPLNSVEGFVRQILGWREYIRGQYWLHLVTRISIILTINWICRLFIGMATLR